MSALVVQPADPVFVSRRLGVGRSTERLARRWGIATAVAIHLGVWGLLVRVDLRPEPVERPRPIRVVIVPPSSAPVAKPTPTGRPEAAPNQVKPQPRVAPSLPAASAQPAATAAPVASMTAPVEPVSSENVAEPIPAPSPAAPGPAPVPALTATLQRPPAPAATPASEPRFDAAYLNNPAPAYPGVSRRLGEHGRVLVRVHVNEQGAPTTVSLSASSGYERLDTVAVETVRRWKFVPARRGEEAVAAWVIVPIVFNLRS